MNNYERLGTLMFRYARRELTGKGKKELMVWRRSRPEEENLFKNSTDPENIMVDVGAFLSSKEKMPSNTVGLLSGYLERFAGQPS